MHTIDRFLNAITMYRLVLNFLGILALISILFGFLNLLPYSGYKFIQLLLLILITSVITQLLFTKIFRAITNIESFLITALILFFILSPIQSNEDIYITIATTVVAIGSKFLFAVNRKHFFNPAAIGILVLSILGYGNGIWWVGSRNLLPIVMLIGFLIIRKLRRFSLFFAFLFTAIVVISLSNLRHGLTFTDSLIQLFTSWPLIFFGSVMLTEPLTTPPKRQLYITYGILTGIFFGLQFNLGPFRSSSELALVVGNVFSYLMSPKSKFLLTLKSQTKLAPQIIELTFTKPPNFTYTPGQYMEFTIPPSQTDARGNRRYFTLASSPTEQTLKLGIKIPDQKPSIFKQKLLSFKTEDQILVGQLAGDFVLPQNNSQKLVFIAGGIGIIPFRSMVKYLIDTDQTRDIVLFYICSHKDEFVYQDIFDQAKKTGLKTVNVITQAINVPKQWSGEVGYLNKNLIVKYVPDYLNRKFYLSGPNMMVESSKHLLKSLNVPNSQISTDYFPGF